MSNDILHTSTAAITSLANSLIAKNGLSASGTRYSITAVIMQLLVIISYRQNVSQLIFCCACPLIFYLLECKGRFISILPCEIIIHPKVCLPAQLVTGCAVRNALNNTTLEGKKNNRFVKHAPKYVLFMALGSHTGYLGNVRKPVPHQIQNF